MKNLSHKRINLLMFSSVLFIIIYLSSCVSQKKVKYVQNKSKDTTTAFKLEPRPLNSIQPFDNLYIKIISPDSETSIMFNSESMNVQTVDYNMISYTVDKKGYIEFPFVGDIYLEGLTLSQAKDTLKTAIKSYIRNSDVVVKFVGKTITVIGEVARQGEYVIYSDNINIFRILSQAGGLTDFGDRRNITIIREIKGVARFYYINLTDKKLMGSKFYYLKPGDTIIVQPLRHKSFGFTAIPYTLILTSLTTMLTLFTFIRSSNQ